MKLSIPYYVAMAMAGAFLALVPARADSDTELSADRLDKLDQLGCFTPAFKAAVHDLIDSKQAIITAKKDEKSLALQVPDLQKQADALEAQVADLRRQAAEYDHTDQNDFVQLQKAMGDSNANLEDLRVLAQAYVWAYPASPHQTEAQQDLQQVQQKIANQTQAEKDAEAARIAARAALIQRAQAHQLSLDEWRNFLNDMSQEDLVKYIGLPQKQGIDYWIYTGSWTDDPTTHQRVGIQVTFNAARVISVAMTPH